MGAQRLVVVCGPPGSGKGTQCELLAQACGFLHLSAGDLLRDEIRRETDIGRHVRETVETGHLVADGIVGEVVLRRLEEHPEAPGALLDGFPRTVAQAEVLDHARPGAVVIAIALVVPRATLVHRLALRDRADDHDHALGSRLAAFERETRPMLSWYGARGLLVQVDGNRSPDAVCAVLLDQLAAAGLEASTPRAGAAQCSGGASSS